jgi:hypothetical protein
MAAAGLAMATATVASLASADSNDWLIVPGKRAGPITPKTKRADLVRCFGAKNVEDGEIITSDGGREAGTLVFGDQPDASLGILWVDDTPDAGIRSIVFCNGSERAEKCRWHTEDGISFGTDLKTLERRNGRKFKLNGFDWGYGGLITSWESGRLERLSVACGRVTLRVDPRPGEASDERQSLIEQVEENDEFLSSDAAMQALNPVVDHISMFFQACNR